MPVSIKNKISSETAILCDFDGTIAIQDVTDTLLDHFANPNWTKIGECYLRGEISHAEMNSKFIKLINNSPQEIENFLEKKIQIREGFNELLSKCKDKGISFIIVSSGWDFYIKKILSDFNLIFLEKIEDIYNLNQKYTPVICNKIVYDPKNLHWKFIPRWLNLSCRLASPCKGKVATEIKKIGFNKVILIGNNEADFCMSKDTDQMYCINTLADLYKNIEIKSVKNFKDIIQIISDQS